MICCVTGHRPGGFPFSPDDGECRLEYKKRLYEEVQALMEQGYRHFITGMADGVDVDFAIAVLYFKNKFAGVTLEAALPYPRNAYQTNADPMNVKENILSKCDRISVVSDVYYEGCMQKRNCYMVDKADIVLAVWNGTQKGGTWNTIRYARQIRKPIRYIMLEECVNMQMRLF